MSKAVARGQLEQLLGKLGMKAGSNDSSAQRKSRKKRRMSSKPNDSGSNDGKKMKTKTERKGKGNAERKGKKRDNPIDALRNIESQSRKETLKWNLRVMAGSKGRKSKSKSHSQLVALDEEFIKRAKRT